MEESNVDPTEAGVERRTLLLEMASDEAKNLEARFAIDPECADHKRLLRGLAVPGSAQQGTFDFDRAFLLDESPYIPFLVEETCVVGRLDKGRGAYTRLAF